MANADSSKLNNPPKFFRQTDSGMQQTTEIQFKADMAKTMKGLKALKAAIRQHHIDEAAAGVL